MIPPVSTAGLLRRRPPSPLRRAVTLLAALVVVLLSAACNLPFDAASSSAYVRLHNNSDFTLEQVRFSCGSEPMELARLNAHTRSNYREVPVAYEVAYVEAVINGERYATPTYSFADHPRLPRGTYTYRIAVDTVRQSLQVVAIAD